MKNYLVFINETQKEELKQRIALELFIENFSVEDLLSIFADALPETLRDLAVALSEDQANRMGEKALLKYGAIADEMVDQEQRRGQAFFIQSAQVLVDFGNQNRFI